MGKFYGRYDRNLDDRNRLQLPSKLFGESLPKSFFALRGFDGCISIYEKREFEALQEELTKQSYLLEEARAFIRITLSSVRELEIDSHGRITIPKELIDRYKLSREVVCLGVNDHFEVWDKEAYERYEEMAVANYEKLAESLGGRING